MADLLSELMNLLAGEEEQPIQDDLPSTPSPLTTALGTASQAALAPAMGIASFFDGSGDTSLGSMVGFGPDEQDAFIESLLMERNQAPQTRQEAVSRIPGNLAIGLYEGGLAAQDLMQGVGDTALAGIDALIGFDQSQVEPEPTPEADMIDALLSSAPVEAEPMDISQAVEQALATDGVITMKGDTAGVSDDKRFGATGFGTSSSETPEQIRDRIMTNLVGKTQEIKAREASDMTGQLSQNIMATKLMANQAKERINELQLKKFSGSLSPEEEQELTASQAQISQANAAQARYISDLLRMGTKETNDIAMTMYRNLMKQLDAKPDDEFS